MRLGTKSLLYGGHCFFIHPLFVARAWWILYGFPWDPRLWVVFFLHDIGYLGKNDIDGEDGERHPELGAKIAGFLFGPEWGNFCLRHSRSYSKRMGVEPSRLNLADKLSIAITPCWLYLPMARATGEITEYIKRSKTGHYPSDRGQDWSHLKDDGSNAEAWHKGMCEFLSEYVIREAKANELAKANLA
jgi:hypothetical protein